MAHRIGPHLKALHDAAKEETRTIGSSADRVAYRRQVNPKGDNTIIPDPQLFCALDTPRIPTGNTVPIPSISECAVHLELLEVFYHLRVQVLQSTELDATFGIHPNKKTVFRPNYSKGKYEPVQLKDATFEGRRAAKWPYFLDLASARFMRWAEEMERAAMAGGSEEPPERIPYLPPLDILMVWHALLLNPLQFGRYCDDHKLIWLRRLPFAWLQIHRAIDSDNWSYKLPEDTETWLTDIGFEDSDLFQYLVEVGRTENEVRTALSGYSFESKEPILSGSDLPQGQSSFEQTLRTAATSQSEHRRLRENVERQASFVDKMHAHLWISSPAVEGTLHRALDRYDKFLQLFKLYPGTTLVPTLDIDLVWHTHQCSPQQYRDSTLKRAGRFINHDDTLGKGTLDHGMDRTAEFFIVRFAQEYNVCKCWDCEAVASAIEKMGDDKLGPEREQIVDIAKQVEDEVNYYRAVELGKRTRKSNQELVR